MSIRFDKNVKCGKEFVAVRVIDNSDDAKIGNIFVTKTYQENGRLAFAKVTDLGSVAKEKTGLEIGDYVMIDRLSTFAWTQPVALLAYGNVICKANEGKSEFFPLKDMVFVEPNKETEKKVDGIFVPDSYDKRLHMGTITKVNFSEDSEYEKETFKVGDKIILTKGADLVDVGEVRLHIYRKENIVCKVID